MDIHFCDLCNESVPQSDLEAGRAFLRKGRVVCATCDHLMSTKEAELAGAAAGLAGASAPAFGAPHSTPGALPHGQGGQAAGYAGQGYTPTRQDPHTRHEAGRVHHRGGGTGAVLSGFLALGSMLLMAGISVMLFERDKEVIDRNDEARDVLRASFKGELDDQKADVRRVRESMVAQAGDLQRAVDRVEQSQTLAARSVDELSSDLDTRLRAIEERLLLLQGFDARVRSNETELVALGPVLAGMDEDLRLMRDGILELENRMQGVRVPGALGDPLADAGEPDAGPPPWFALTEDLEDPSAGTRWQAVQALGQTRDPAVIKHLVPMMTDDDIFVRMAAARILGDLGSPSAIPALIGGLEDAEPSVREAAVVSLRDLAGEQFGFDPTASDSDRARRVKNWRDWWERNEEDILG